MDMAKDFVVATLEAIRAQVDALLTVMDQPEECEHPASARKNYTTMGGPERWQCTICGYMHSGEGKG